MFTAFIRKLEVHIESAIERKDEEKSQKSRQNGGRMAENVLQLQGISKYYYTDASVTQALRKINLEFSMGEFVAITGESGGGKSTLLNIISGLDTFDEGEMYFRGQPTFQFDEADWEEYRRNQIGFVFQDYSLLNQYSALDNIVAALMIQEMDPDEAKEKALDYLKQVGLGEMAHQRASQLSSGQKQRLSIARALAKNTDIIVADEPTGNLDSETGQQIIQLLEKLSRDKLVIMVTHNYDQAEPYVSRKIRLHDGELVTDIPVKKRVSTKEDGKDSENAGKAKEETVVNAVSKKVGKKADKKADKINKKTAKRKTDSSEKKKSHHIATFFAKKNMETQIGRTVLFYSFFLITTVVSFLFIGELLYYADDRVTKEYDNAAYLKKDDTRLIVRYPDNSALTEEDGKKLASVKNVDNVDLYDLCNDVNYYIKEGEGYEYFFAEKEKKEEERIIDGEKKMVMVYKDVIGVRFLDNTKFVRSDYCLTEDDLSAGRLPENRNEIVLYSKDKNALDSKELCYFSADNIWTKGQPCRAELTVVGLLKEKTDQIYFDSDLCQMLTATLDGVAFEMDYCYDWQFKKYNGNMDFVPVIASDLEENQVRISRHYDLPSTGYGVLPDTLEGAFQVGEDEDGNPIEGSGILHMKESQGGVPDEDASSSEMEEDVEEEDSQNDEQTDKNEKEKQEDKAVIYADDDDLQTHEVRITNTFSEQGADFIEMSEELFYTLYEPKTTQASVYISHYSKTEKVMEELIAMGYDVISSYQISTTEYIPEKVMLRLEVIGISCLVLLALLVLQILIVRSFMKIKIKDYYILKFMGMQLREMKQISYLEMGVHCVAAMITAGIVMLALDMSKVPFIVGIMDYYSVSGVIYFILYNVVLMILTVFFFNRLLKRKVR